MEFLIDTNIIIRHFSGTSSIGKNAKEIIFRAEQNEHKLLISIVSMMEILYLAEKKNIPISLKETIDQIKSKPCYSIIDLNMEILQVAESIKFYELHDRIILATAKFFNIPILSSDRKFSALQDFKIIW
jgi:predicted nucleic acid-binding protein